MERQWHSSAVVSVVRRTGETESIAAGSTLDGVPMRNTTLVPWFCAAKPLLGLMLAILVSRNEVGWDDALARFVPRFARGGRDGITIRHVLTHSIGLLNDPVELLGLDWDVAVGTIARTRPVPGWMPGREHSYLPFTSWYLIGEVLIRATGQQLGPLVREQVIEPLALRETYIGMTADEYRAVRDRLAGVGTHQVRGSVDRHQFRLPIDGADICGGTGPMSVRGTMADLARLYATLGLSDDPPLGITPRVWREYVARPSDPVFDQRHQIPVVLGMGLVFEGRQYGEGARVFGPYCSPDTLGHRGLGSLVAFADRTAGTAVAAFFDVTNQPLLNRGRIDLISSCVYRDLGLRCVPHEVGRPSSVQSAE
ncbi:serine hydrolase domain-containing protein [Dactylosporangium matsuzakiense]|uniref:serine hydrolase domain-containing protein n=1 Tax=Dactylosporangium matsuzakiense TaxID=53360 RepID=UPI0022F2D0A3|nr:serine hydrolase domain-containing protein [Dactylosporangium matsuzakiense]